MSNALAFGFNLPESPLFLPMEMQYLINWGNPDSHATLISLKDNYSFSELCHYCTTSQGCL